jgi:hypothetical protein
MFFYLKPHHIRTFFTAIFRTFGMSNYFEFEKGRQMDVEAYRQLLLLQYRDDNDDGRMKSTKVTELHHYKQMSKSSQHEYVVARIMAPNGSTAYISFERLSGERGDPQSAKAHNPHSQQPSPSPSPSSDKVQAHTYENSHGQQPTPSPSSSSDKAPVGTATNSRQPLSLIPPSSSSTSLDSLKSHSAQDIVRALGKPKQEHDDVFVGKLRFKDDCPLYLYNLATLAVTLHKSELSYELLSNNCYWFAGVLIKVLESCFQIKFEHAKPPQPKPGGWKTITICKPSKEEVEKVIDEFNKSVKSFEEKVNLSIGVLVKTHSSLR